MTKHLILLATLMLLASCATAPTDNTVDVNTPLGDVRASRTAPSVDGMIKTVEFKDCLSRYERDLGSNIHSTRAWCDCHIGQSDQWRGQQWQAYCTAEPPAPPAMSVSGEIEVSTPTVVSRPLPVPTPEPVPEPITCADGQWVKQDGTSTTCADPPEPEIVYQSAKLSDLRHCLDTVVHVSDTMEESIQGGKTATFYRTTLGCILSRVQRAEREFESRTR